MPTPTVSGDVVTLLGACQVWVSVKEGSHRGRAQDAFLALISVTLGVRIGKLRVQEVCMCLPLCTLNSSAMSSAMAQMIVAWDMFRLVFCARSSFFPGTPRQCQTSSHRRCKPEVGDDSIAALFEKTGVERYGRLIAKHVSFARYSTLHLEVGIE